MHKSEYKAFYELHVDRVYRFIYFRIQDKETAEDLTSETFLNALKHFHTYDPTKSKSAWIMTIARNLLANHYRDRKIEIDVDEVSFTLPGEDGRVSIERREAELTLRQALDLMPAKDRKLIEMKYLLGYGYKDMAEEIGKTDGALKVETHRAMKKLRDLLKNTQLPGLSASEGRVVPASSVTTAKKEQTSN